MGLSSGKGQVYFSFMETFTIKRLSQLSICYFLWNFAARKETAKNPKGSILYRSLSGIVCRSWSESVNFKLV